MKDASAEVSASEPGEYRPFVSRRGPAVAYGFALATLVVFGVVAFLVIPSGGEVGWSGVDRWAMFMLGVVIAAFLCRWGLIKATPSAEGITVRNLLITRFVHWDEIVGVQFGGGGPWCLLELMDTETLAVMAIQRADGPRAEQEAQRLANLVAAHTSKVPND